MALKIKDLERMVSELNYSRNNQSFDDDSELLERVVYELEREKDKNESLRIQNTNLEN